MRKKNNPSTHTFSNNVRALFATAAVVAVVLGLAACTLTPTQEVVDQQRREEIHAQATRDALTMKATTIAIDDQARRNDLNYAQLVATQGRRIGSDYLVSMIAIISMAVLCIGGAFATVRWVQMQATTVRRGPGQSPLIVGGTLGQTYTLDPDKSVNPVVVVGMPPLAAQLRAAITGRPEPLAEIASPALADPAHQLRVTTQSQATAMIVAATANRPADSVSGARQLMAANLGPVAGLMTSLDASTNMPTNVTVTRLDVGQDAYVRNLLPAPAGLHEGMGNKKQEVVFDGE